MVFLTNKISFHTPHHGGRRTSRMWVMPGCSGQRQSLRMGTGVPCGPAAYKHGSPGAVPPGHKEEAHRGVLPVNGNWLRAPGRVTESRSGGTRFDRRKRFVGWSAPRCPSSPEATNRHPALRSASPGDPGRGTCVLSEIGSQSVPEQLRKSSGRRSEQQNKANLSVQETQSDQAPGPVARAAL